MKRALFPPVITLVSLIASCLLVSCARVSVTPPEGFAEIDGRGAYRAVSPEGMRYRVRILKNRPAKDMQFWSEALRSHLLKEGYRLNGEPRSLENGDTPGVLCEWVLPYGNESYVYLTALMVSGRTIILAEAAAAYPVFLRYREALRESLATIRPR